MFLESPQNSYRSCYFCYSLSLGFKLVIKLKVEISFPKRNFLLSISLSWHVSSQAYFYLKRLPRLDEVFLQYIVKSGIKLFAHILDDQRSSQRERIFQMRSEILVVEGCDLMANTSHQCKCVVLTTARTNYCFKKSMKSVGR